VHSAHCTVRGGHVTFKTVPDAQKHLLLVKVIRYSYSGAGKGKREMEGGKGFAGKVRYPLSTTEKQCYFCKECNEFLDI
jgi:hypothetical protein